MPFTANKGLGVQTVGSNSGTWGSGAADALNETVMGYMDRMIGGTLSQALSNVNVTWTTDQSRDMVGRLTGTLTGNVIITTPGIGFYYIENATTGSFTVTLQYTGGVGGTVVCPQGYTIPVIVDATNGVRVATGVTAGTVTRYGLYDALSIKGTDIASAATVNLETATGNLVDVTGTVTVTAITLSEGHERTVRFTGILVLTNGASLVLPGAASITTAAGDYAIFRGYSGGIVRCTNYQRATMPPNAAASDTGKGPIEIAVQSEMEAGSSTTLAVTPGRQQFHPLNPKGTLKFSASGAVVSGTVVTGNISGVVRDSTGRFTISFSPAFANTDYTVFGTIAVAASARGGGLFTITSTKTVSAIQVGTDLYDDSDAPTDPAEVSVMVLGSFT